MYMDMSQIWGLLGAIVGLAVIAVVIVNGGKTAQIISASGTAFSNAIKAASGVKAA
jgi:hypothetical protein